MVRGKKRRERVGILACGKRRIESNRMGETKEERAERKGGRNGEGKKAMERMK